MKDLVSSSARCLGRVVADLWELEGYFQWKVFGASGHRGVARRGKGLGDIAAPAERTGAKGCDTGGA